MCVTTERKRYALLLGYVALACLSFNVIASALATASYHHMRPSYKFQLLWHALMTFCTMLIVIYWRAFRATSNFYLSAAVVTLFMMALQSVSATSAAWTWEGDLHTQEGSITFGQGWVGFSTLMYTVGAATHLGMMCAWRHIDIDAYEAVPMGVLKGGTQPNLSFVCTRVCLYKHMRMHTCVYTCHACTRRKPKNVHIDFDIVLRGHADMHARHMHRHHCCAHGHRFCILEC